MKKIYFAALIPVIAATVGAFMFRPKPAIDPVLSAIGDGQKLLWCTPATSLTADSLKWVKACKEYEIYLRIGNEKYLAPARAKFDSLTRIYNSLIPSHPGYTMCLYQSGPDTIACVFSPENKVISRINPAVR